LKPLDQSINLHPGLITLSSLSFSLKPFSFDANMGQCIPDAFRLGQLLRVDNDRSFISSKFITF